LLISRYDALVGVEVGLTEQSPQAHRE